MKDNINFYINKFSLKNHLNDSLIESCKLISFKKGEYITKINEPIENMYFLVSGKAKVYTLISSGKTLLLAFNTPLSIVGDLEILENPLADCNVVALEDCLFLAIPQSKIKEFGYTDSNFLLFIISSLSKKIRNNSTYSSINLLYPLENRFASYLLAIPFNREEQTVLIESLTHVAELLGTSYRHLNRVITSLSSKGIISKNKNTIKILNLPSLKLLGEDIFIVDFL